MKYLVIGHMTISVSVEIEAESPADARKQARQAPIMGLCRQCAQGEDRAWSTSGDLDGTVTISSVEDLGAEMGFTEA